MAERARKAWNGGSIDRAMELAQERRETMIAQGASLCQTCGGAGGTSTALCAQCHGAGVIIPDGGLKIASAHPAPATAPEKK